MTVGEKIKTIRTFRGMTQRELGLAVGFPEKNADNRIAQYETDYRVPRKEMLDKIAFALHTNCLNFYSIYEGAGAAEDIMRTLFWLEESNMGRVQLVQTTPNTLPEKHDDRLRAIEDTTFHYNPSDDWPVCPPVAIYFDCIVDSFMRERSHRLLSGAKTNKDKQKTALLNFVVQQSGFTCPLQLFSAILFRLT